MGRVRRDRFRVVVCRRIGAAADEPRRIAAPARVRLRRTTSDGHGGPRATQARAIRPDQRRRLMPDAVGGYVLDVAALIGVCRRQPYPEAVVWGTVLTDGVLV